MRVLIACEFSGIVRKAFAEAGHEAWSCDLLPTEDPSNRNHIVSDIFELLDGWQNAIHPWDLLIFHWPCTLLCNSGVRWLSGNCDRYNSMVDSARNFKRILDCGIPMICGENPIPHKYAAAIMGPYTQIIQPWQFGHGETKATCLWLKNLPKLRPTQIVEGRVGRVWREAPSPERWKNRSRTYQGIANAMAEQWGNLKRDLEIAHTHLQSIINKEGL